MMQAAELAEEAVCSRYFAAAAQDCEGTHARDVCVRKVQAFNCGYELAVLRHGKWHADLVLSMNLSVHSLTLPSEKP